MSKDEEPPDGVAAAAPSMLDLIHLSRRPLFPPGGVDLYRQIALLTEIVEGQEVLDVACGQGVTLEYFVRHFGVHGSGVEADSLLVAKAEERVRAEGLGGDINFQKARADDLPYVDEVFDVSIGELGLTGSAELRDVIRELVRVTKTGGAVVLIQLGWKASVDRERQKRISEQLGSRPVGLVEVKRFLMDEGVGQLHTEDWSDDAMALRPRLKRPFPDFAELFTVSERLGILRRAGKRWGWRGVRAALTREFEVHRLLTKERILGLDLIKGTKGTVAGKGDDEERPEQESLLESGVVTDRPADHAETEGLPLFQKGEGDG